MIIDAHTHIFGPELVARRDELCRSEGRFGECYAEPRARMVSAEDLLAAMDAAGVDKAVVTGYAFADGALCQVSNDYVIAAVQKYPDRLIGLAAVQPNDGDKAVYEAERCLKAGLRGLGELTADGQSFDPPAPALLKDLAALLTKHGAVMMLHASEPVGHRYPGKGQTTPDKVLKLAQNFPDLKIIAAHWGGGLPFYELMPEVARDLTNLYYDTAATSYLYRFGIFRAVCDIIGPDKILFASDYPVLGPARLLHRIRTEGLLSDDEQAQILGGNAARILSMKDE